MTRVRAASASHACRIGIHFPDRSTLEAEGDLERARCRHCGCSILRMTNARYWLFSGELG